MGQANGAMVSEGLGAIMSGMDGSPTGITNAAGNIVRLAKSSVPERAGLDHPVLKTASECLVKLAQSGYNVGHIRDLLQGLGNHFDPTYHDRAPRTQTCGPILYEG